MTVALAAVSGFFAGILAGGLGLLVLIIWWVGQDDPPGEMSEIRPWTR